MQTGGPAWPAVGLWAQVSTTSVEPLRALLALRRWYADLTLSPPGGSPGLSGLWAWLLGLGGLLLLVVCVQGPGGALRQLFDLPGHVGLVREAIGRLTRAGRMLSVVIGLTVLSWTGSQAITFRSDAGRDAVLLLTRGRAAGEVALEHAVLAALTPLRDVAGLAGNLPLLMLACALLFRTTAGTWGLGASERSPHDHAVPSGWASVGWVCGSLYALYRMVCLAAGSYDLPLGGCLTIEGLVVPLLMVVCDGVLLAWLLAELRGAGLRTHEAPVLDVRAPAALMPGAALACLAILPARYLATALLLAAPYVPGWVTTSSAGAWLRWQLSWGVADLQAVALAGAGLAGAVAWTHGSARGALRMYARTLSGQGARVVVVLFLAGLAGAAGAWLATFVLLSLPPSTWVLAAADGYSHYLTLPVGLWTLAALVELSERSLPVATAAPVRETAGTAGV